jgi:hypothetical protein
MAALDLPALDAALEPLSRMLAADGYELHLSVDTGHSTLVMDILPTEAACADCLVPPETIAAVAQSHLVGAGVAPDELTLDIRHPKDR